MNTVPIREVSDSLVVRPGVDLQKQVIAALNELQSCEYNKTRQKVDTNSFEIKMVQEELRHVRHVYVQDRELSTHMQERSAQN